MCLILLPIFDWLYCGCVYLFNFQVKIYPYGTLEAEEAERIRQMNMVKG